jgi:hypothetical protein
MESGWRHFDCHIVPMFFRENPLCLAQWSLARIGIQTLSFTFGYLTTFACIP